MLSVDEKSQIQALDRTQPTLPFGQVSPSAHKLRLQKARHHDIVCRLCRMRHSRHYAASRTMPRVGVRAAIHGHLNSGDAA